MRSAGDVVGGPGTDRCANQHRVLSGAVKVHCAGRNVQKASGGIGAGGAGIELDAVPQPQLASRDGSQGMVSTVIAVGSVETMPGTLPGHLDAGPRTSPAPARLSSRWVN